MPYTLTDPEAGLVGNSYVEFWEHRWSQSQAAGNGAATDGPSRQFLREKVNELLALGARTVLDIGCGACNQWGGELPVPEQDYTGLDVSSEAIGYAAAKHPGAKFVHANVVNETQLVRDEPVDSADLVICTDMLQHIRPQDYYNVLQFIKFFAKQFFVLRTWCNHPDWDRAGNYHWNHPEPESDERWLVTKHPSPEGTFTLYIGHRRAPEGEKI